MKYVNRNDLTDLEMLQHPEYWQHYPLLPVKKPHEKPGEFPYCGVVIHCGLNENGHTYLFMPDANIWNRIEIAEKVSEAESITTEKLLADGWVVD